ncbi:TetR/AcrR family transcriptional regulator [Consotaella aegiceratis]|uniref:TetR/AcrR family transcriptional regulator n=1 Tax=Consotaella aegiceratis TaxID=3097961 RepID=UPI002F3E84BC
MSKRISRAESRAQTRQKLIEAASMLFARTGYASSSVDAIAEAAGFTKGALYAHFPTKAAIFLAVFDQMGRNDVEALVTEIRRAKDRPAVESLLIEWAHMRSAAGLWPLTILEFSRLSEKDGASLEDLRAVLRRHWRTLGEAALTRISVDVDATVFGAALHEIAYAPAMTFVRYPTAADLMTFFLSSLRRR